MRTTRGSVSGAWLEMTEDEARRVELVRAFEADDPDGTLLTREDIAQAERHARDTSAHSRRRGGGETFISARAEFASARLATRHPGIAGLLERASWSRWLGLVPPVLAFALGFLANEFGTDKRLDLLAVPLLGTVAWNLLVYAWLLITLFAPGPASFAHPVYRAVAWLRGFGRRSDDPGTPLQRAAHAFEMRWASAAGPLTSARVARTFHLAAALFAVGLIAGIYVRALVIEYRAGWESTFLGPEAVRTLLSGVLGPASWLSGVPIPPLESITAMRWTGPGTGGVNAAPWIHLYVMTLIGTVVVPRLLLFLWQAIKAFRLERRFPVPGREDFYIRRLLRGAGGAAAQVRITPYAYDPGQETQRRLSAALRAALGDGAQIRFDQAIEYGGEDRWLSEHPANPADDYHILLFTLAATPEEENHGTLAATLSARGATEQKGTAFGALVDETPYRAHFAGQAGLSERIAARLDAWRSALSASGLRPLGLDLSRDADAELAKRIESGLLPDGAMHG
jgi:hypothetical protein